MAGLLPTKSLVPPAYSGADETKWREWSEDILDFFDAVRPGLKATLKATATVSEDKLLDDYWIVNTCAVNGMRRQEAYTALKGLTQGEAKIVVQSVRGNDGFLAWRALHMRYYPSVASRQGLAMADLAMMATKPAKNQADLRAKLVELER